MTEKPARTKKSAQEILAAVAVAVIAFCAPNEDTGMVLRAVSAALALVTLLLASEGSLLDIATLSSCFDLWSCIVGLVFLC